MMKDKPGLNFNMKQVFKDFIFDRDMALVVVNGREEPLTKLEYKLLDYFIKHKNIILNKEVLLVNVWGYNSEINSTAINPALSCLREKIGKQNIINRRNLGYIFIDSDSE